MSWTIMIVDDETMITTSLSTLIKMTTKNNVLAFNSPEMALECLSNEKVEMILSDFMMPGMNGLEFLKKAKGKNPDAVTIMLTGYADKENAIKSINEVGLYYYVEKPWDNNKLMKIVQNGLEKRYLNEELKKKIIELEVSNKEIARMYDLLKKDYQQQTDNVQNLIISLANVIEAKDRYTDGHTRRVGNLSRMLAVKMNMQSERLQDLEISAMIHDIGKVAVQETILNKPGKLSSEEFDEIKKHTAIGEMICKPLNSLRNCLDPIRHHHEKLNGTGYPDGLKGDEISLEARIIAIADIFDALYSDRPYRGKLEMNTVKEIMYGEVSKGLLDGVLVDALFDMIDKKEVDDIIDG